MKRDFYLQDDRSNKFWTVAVVGEEMLTENGRIGAKPRQTRTRFNSEEAALKAAEKEMYAKRRKGYLEGDPAQLPPYTRRLPPRLIKIRPDDHHAKYVGKTKDGMQLFLTFPFAPSTNEVPGGNFIALYLFDEFGALARAEIFHESNEGLTTQTAVNAFVEQLLRGLAPFKYDVISVTPFSVAAFGMAFGLIFHADEDAGEMNSDVDDDEDEDDDDPVLWVTAEPGDYMAFYPPWDGEYDT